MNETSIYKGKQINKSRADKCADTGNNMATKKQIKGQGDARQNWYI
mgnify:CR=1 FL=1